MDITLNDITRLFLATDYSLGMQYYHQGRVQDMRETTVYGQPQVECTVRDTELHDVMFREGEHQIYVHCSCLRNRPFRTCRHLAAAMIAYVMDPPPPDQPITDRSAKLLLNHYVQRGSKESKPAIPARLIPKINTDRLRRNEYPYLTFRVGQDKFYAVRQIRTFLENVKSGKTVALGKKVSMDHSISQFDDRSRALIRILMNRFPEFNAIDQSYSSGYYHDDNRKNEITLIGDSFDRLFNLYVDDEVESENGTIRLCVQDPKVTVKLSRREHSAELIIQTPQKLRFFGNIHSLYAISASTLYRCSADFRERVYPLLRSGDSRMQLALSDLPTFCGCVLPEISEQVTVQDPDGLLMEYLPDDCTPCFYFDLEDDTLSVTLKFRYGEQEYPELKEPNEPIRRDARQEQLATALVMKHFALRNDGYVLTGEDHIFTFLTEGLARFRAMGDVYISDRLQRRQIPNARVNVGVSVSDGILLLDLDTGEFPAEELESLYQSLLKKKKYHRLADGRFLTLEGGSYEKLAEMAHMLQLSPKDLAKGTLELPAFRALYLDSVLSGNEELNVIRDRQFRGMIRNFKSLTESDYVVPEHLEQVMRPYQRLGFQWLKTLESCGFGGILADEMGLGKTLQVIAYLSTLNRVDTKHPSLVVCPASLILNWGEEFARFAPDLKVSLIYGNAAERKALIAESTDRDVWVTSYELLRQDISIYKELEFYACILDEGQHIKNQSTLVSKAVKTVNCRQRFVLTGTPIENRLSELWNLFDFLMPGYLFSHRGFVEKLEKPIVKSKNEDAMAQLRKLVKPFILRRMKHEVLKELPPKIEHIRRIALGETERKTYLSAVNATKSALGDTGKLQILAALTQLRQVCCDPNLCFENYQGETSKLEACLELCAGMVANGHQILLFSQFTSMLDILRKRLDEMNISSFTLQGSTPKEQRARLVKEFNAGGASVFLISLKAGGTGLNLTAADVVIHYDPWWNLAAQNQATDRAHRIGQRQCVQVYKLIAKDTIEERILDLQDKKAELLDMISGEGGSILEMTKEELLALLD